MKKEFFQEILNNAVFKKLTTVFSFLRKDELTNKDLQEILKGLNQNGLINAIENSGQDPKELAEMTLIAFDKAVKDARERLLKTSDQMVKFIQKERFS